MNERILSVAEFLEKGQIPYFAIGDGDRVLCQSMAGGVQCDIEIASMDENNLLRFSSVFPVVVEETKAADALLLANALNRVAAFGTFTFDCDSGQICYRSNGELAGDLPGELEKLFERHFTALRFAARPLALFALGILTVEETFHRVANGDETDTSAPEIENRLWN